TKSVFRAAMRGIMPDEVLDRRDKIGFETPEDRWLAGMADTVRDWLRHGERIPFLNHPEIMRHFEAVMAGKARCTTQLWRWVNFIKWHELSGIQYHFFPPFFTTSAYACKEVFMHSLADKTPRLDTAAADARPFDLRARLLAIPRYRKRMLQVSVDIPLIWLSLWLAFALRLDDPAAAHPFGAHAWLFALAPLLTIPVLARGGLYRAVLRYLGMQALWTIAK